MPIAKPDRNMIELQKQTKAIQKQVDYLVKDGTNIFKDCKRYIDVANAKQNKWIGNIAKDGTNIFKDCKRYIDVANGKQNQRIDALVREINDLKRQLGQR